MVVIGVIVFLFGLAIGSFTNVLIYRIPLEKSIVYPPSACTSCGNRLTALDLVPVFSYIFLKGRCRHCGAPVSGRYPLVELLTALIFVALFMKYGISVPFIAFAFIMTILIAVFFIDMDHRIIPDELVITGIIGGTVLVIYNCISPMTVIYGDSNWWTPVIGFFSGSLFLLLVAILGIIIYKSDDAMGMGDVKLMAPIGLFLGWKLCLAGLLLAVTIAGVVSLFLIITRIKKRRDAIPFGPFIVTGAFIAIMWGWDLINWYIGTGSK
jgi:leader peptidase (prepilin peptidase) / N-methyltransferase